MLGVGGLSLSMGVLLERSGFTDKAGSRYDSRNLVLMFAALKQKWNVIQMRQ